MYYVTMTDTVLSGWGQAEGKINKLVFQCESYDQAALVEQNALDRTDQKYINIRSTRPYYNKDRYYTQFKTIKDYPTWYETNRPFKRRK